MNFLEEIKKSGCLKIGTTLDYFPLTYIDSVTGDVAGEDLELGRKIAREIGVAVQFIKTGWPCLEKDLIEKKFDLALGGITITEERCKNFLMSKGYRKSGKTILCRRDDAGRFGKLEDVNKPDVLVMYNPGGTNEKFVMKNLMHAQKIMHPVNQEIPELIAQGKAQVMITETVEAEYYIKKNNSLVAPLLAQPFTKDEFGVMMTKENEELLRIVNSIIG